MTSSSATILKWFWAVRPLTLIASVAPVFIGAAMAFGDGVGHGPSACAALAVVILIQIGTNLSKDYFDFKKGAGSLDRVGPPDAISSGIFSAQQVKWGFIIAFSLAGLVACFLIARAGWPILMIVIISILSGLFYTAGPRPLANLGLGDILVLFFFGPVAVGGTYFVQSFEINPAVVMAGFGPGFLSMGIFAVNNLRDIDSDRRAAKLTAAVRFGQTFACYEYLFCIMAAAAVPVIVHVMIGANAKMILASGIIFLFIPTIHEVFTSTNYNVLDRAWERTGKLLLIYTIIYSLAWII